MSREICEGRKSQKEISALSRYVRRTLNFLYFARVDDMSPGFAIDVILGRIETPVSSNAENVLAKREAWLISDMRTLLAESSHSSNRRHRNVDIEAKLLPQALPLVEAIGHRIAYDAAVRAGVGPKLMDLFTASVMQLDPAWFSEYGGIPRSEQIKLQQDAAAALYPVTNSLCDDLGVGPYVHAPIVSDESWSEYVGSLSRIVGDVAYVDRFSSTKSRL